MLERRKVEQSQKVPLSRKMPMKATTKSSLLKPSSALLVSVNPKPPPLQINKKESLPKIVPLPKTPTGKSPSPVKLTPLHSPLNKQKPRNITPTKPNISINSKIIQHIHIGGDKLGESKTIIRKPEGLLDENLAKENQRLLAKLKEVEALHNKEREEWKGETLKAKIWLEQLLVLAGDKAHQNLKEMIKTFIYNGETELKGDILGKIEEVSEVSQSGEAETYKAFIEYKNNAKAVVMPTFMKSLRSENDKLY